MGLMDNIKGAQDMAKQAQEAAAGQQAAAMGGADMQKMQWTNRIGQEGMDGEGTIKAVEPTGNVDVGGAREFKITVDASLGGDPYEATALQNLAPTAEDMYKPGAKFNIKADPEDKTRILLMGGIE